MDFFVHLDERKWPLGEVRLYISGSAGGGGGVGSGIPKYLN